jgi:hypothetical protein
MKNPTPIAILFIAVYASAVLAAGPKVYRCGSTYSQIPCADAVTVDAQDTRTKAQKSQADAATKTEAATANAMEKARLAEEAKAREDSKHNPTKSAEKSAQKVNDDSLKADNDRKSKTKKKTDPDLFIARVPVEKKAAGASAPK